MQFYRYTMNKLILFWILLFPEVCFSQVSTQPKSYRGVPVLDELGVLWWGKADLQTRDSSLFEAVYHTRYKRQARTGKTYEMLTVLQVGAVWQKYYSMIRQQIDDVQRDVTGAARGIAPVPGMGYIHTYTEEERHIQRIAGVDFLNSEVWIDRQQQLLTERAHGIRRSNESYEYEESVPAFGWQLSGDTADSVAGYRCMTATASFRGRVWKAWFTIEVPVNTGPWKFGGLPGLIVKIEDDEGDYQWELVSLEQKKVPIVYYAVDQVYSLSRARWHRYWRQVHTNPLLMLNEGGNLIYTHKGNEITEADNWTLPYNPIELE